MEDYEHEHAAAWQSEEEIEKRRRNRAGIASTYPSGSSGENGASPSKYQASGTRSSSNTSPPLPNAFNINNRNHSAYQAMNVAGMGSRPGGTQGRREHLVQPQSTRDRRPPYRPRGSGHRDRRGRETHQVNANQVGFSKVLAYDTRRETREQQKAEEDGQKQTGLERPDDLHAYDYQLLYLWPSEDIPMEELVQHYGKDVVQELARGSRSYIEFDHSMSLIKVWSFDEQAIQSLALRIGNLVKELIAKINNSRQMRFVQRPRHGIIDAMIKPQPYLNTRFVAVDIHYEPNPADDEDPTRRAVNVELRNKMAQIVQQCFKTIREPKKHVRMRAKLGFAVLGRRWQLQLGREGWDYNEFQRMITDNLTEVSLESFAPAGLKSKQLEKIQELEVLTNPLKSYAAEFHFDDSTAITYATLVIEHEWVDSHSSGELELKERRWISLPNKLEEKPLELTVFAFDVADFQLQIEKANVFGNNIVRKQLRKFESGIKFVVHPEAFTTTVEPRPQSRYPRGIGNLKRIVEKTTMTFDIQDSTYKFAITRYDHFRIEASLGRTTWEHTRFEYSLFDPEWDTNLAEFGALAAGQDVSWKRVLNTFFPRPWNLESNDLRAGFFHFLTLAEDIGRQVLKAVQDAT